MKTAQYVEKFIDFCFYIFGHSHCSSSTVCKLFEQKKIKFYKKLTPTYV